MDNYGINPLDSNNINIDEYYKVYIKNKSIDELISQDNKVFAGIPILLQKSRSLKAKNTTLSHRTTRSSSLQRKQSTT